MKSVHNRWLAVLGTLCLFGWARPAVGQDSRSELELSFGFTTPAGEIWGFGQFPLVFPPTGLTHPDTTWDTLALTQSVGGGPTLSVSFVKSLSSSFGLGWNVRLNFLASDKSCDMLFNSGGPGQRDGAGRLLSETNANVGTCARADQTDDAFGVLDLLAFVQLNPIRLGSTRPYLRLGGGISAVPNTSGIDNTSGTIVIPTNSSPWRPAYRAAFGFEMLGSGTSATLEIGMSGHRFDETVAVAIDHTATSQQVWHNQLTFSIGMKIDLGE